MGVGKQMKTFLAAMNEQMGGYGPQIRNTPMGPFKWNDVLELWENVNNGMVMNNISFQDMFIMGYENNSGDNGNVNNCIYVTPTITGWSPDINQGPGENATSPTSPAFTNTCPISLTSEAVDLNANDLLITTSINGGAFNSHTLGTSITIPPSATLAINVDANTAIAGLARFRFRNSSSTNETVWAVSVTIQPPPP